MKLCRSSGGSYVDALSNMASLSTVNLSINLPKFLSGSAPLELVADYLHELTHHHCMNGNAGWALSLLWLRASRSTASDNPEAVCDAAKLSAFFSVYRPWLEGLACFAEFDAAPNSTDAANSSTVEMFQRHFVLGRLTAEERTSVSGDQYWQRHLKILSRARLTETLVSRKVDFLCRPIDALADGGYFSGYMAVKDLAARLIPDKPTNDLSCMYLVHLLFDDPALIAALLERHEDVEEAVSAVVTHGLRISRLLLGHPAETVLQLDLQYWTSEYAAQPPPTPQSSFLATTPGSMIHINPGHGWKLLDENHLQALKYEDIHLVQARSLFVVGNLPGRLEAVGNSRAIFATTSGTLSGLETIGPLKGPLDAVGTYAVVPGIRGDLLNFSDNRSVLASWCPLDWRETSWNRILDDHRFDAEGHLIEIASRKTYVEQALQAGPPGLPALLTSARSEAARLFEKHVLTLLALEPVNKPSWREATQRSGLFALFEGNRLLLRKYAATSIYQSNSAGAVRDATVDKVVPGAVLELVDDVDRLGAVIEERYGCRVVQQLANGSLVAAL